MKKFGTPIGAGPGSEREKLGFDADGTPLPVGRATFFLALALRWPADVVVEVVVVCGRLDGFCVLVGWLGAGLGPVLEADDVEVELEVELDEADELEVELDEDDELELELLELDREPVGLVLELVVVLDELVLSGTQFSVSEAITPATGGRLRLETGVPGVTLGTVKV